MNNIVNIIAVIHFSTSGFCLASVVMSVKALLFRAVHSPRAFVPSFVRSDIVTTISHE